MKVSIITIGDELLLGQVIDTNSRVIAMTIAPAGWEVDSITTVGDNDRDIRRAIEDAMSRTDVVLTTGGLGPTKDDITKNVLTEIFGGRLEKDDSVLENVRQICDLRGISLNDLTAQQALVPTSCRVIQNKLGTAPLMVFEKDGKTLVSMPGVPFEMKGMFVSEVFPQLLKKYGNDMVIAHRTILIYKVIESEIARRLASFEESLPQNIHLAYLPTPGLVRLRLDGIGRDSKEINSQLDKLSKAIKAEFNQNVLWDEDKTLAEITIELLKHNHYTISTAESCTGGRIAAALTAVPGSTKVFRGSVVAYNNDVKSNVLGVTKESLRHYGAVSLPVVEQMAQGVSTHAIISDCSIATSGIAGPGGGTPTKPVGTVCIAVKTPAGIIVDNLHFPGDRDRVMDRTVNTALIKMIVALKNNKK